MAGPPSTQLDEALVAARQWLEAQAAPEEGSGEWYALNNFRGFVDTVGNDPSPEEIERACHALGWHIVDQYGTDDCWKVISAFNERIRLIGKDMDWEQSKGSSVGD